MSNYVKLSIHHMMIKNVHSDKTGKDYAQVGINLLHNGETIVGRILVGLGAVKDSKNSPFKTVLIGDPSREIKVTVRANEDGTYEQVTMTAEELKAANKAARDAYKAAQETAEAADEMFPEGQEAA